MLTVLLLVAILSVVTAVALERLTIASRMTRNIVSADQARAYLITAEQMATQRIGQLIRLRPDRLTLEGGWLSRDQSIAVPGGTVIARMIDRGNCFNLNSLVVGPNDGQSEGEDGDALYDGATLVARPEGIAQFAGLMRLLGIDHVQAQQIAISAADWIDSDLTPGNGGAEDEYYSQLTPGYRAANGLMADPSELLMVSSVTPDVYQRVRPWLCALPSTQPSPININTLLPGQAVLLAMLAPDKLALDQARQVLAQRPADGYGSIPDFWQLPVLVKLGLPQEVQSQTKLTTRWFEVALRADLGGEQVEETVLIDAGTRGKVHVVRRQWGEGS